MCISYYKVHKLASPTFENESLFFSLTIWSSRLKTRLALAIKALIVGTLLLHCVVPENIQTPTTEGIGNSEGAGDQWPRKFQRGGGFRGQIHFQMVGKMIDFS